MRTFKRRDFLRTLGWGAASVGLAGWGGFTGCRAKNRLPNIVLIFTDDQGYGDVGCYGAEAFETPNLDRMAIQGIRFSDFYVAQPVCGASRAALLTGCYPNRIQLQGAPDHRARHGIHSDETLLSELLKPLGYATAIYGKWHLGHLPPSCPHATALTNTSGFLTQMTCGPIIRNDPRTIQTFRSSRERRSSSTTRTWTG